MTNGLELQFHDFFTITWVFLVDMSGDTLQFAQRRLD